MTDNAPLPFLDRQESIGMHGKSVAVIGAGIVGVTTAYELASNGYKVTVFERRGSAAEESSFANAGLMAPGYLGPWAAPGMPKKLALSFFKHHSATRLAWPLLWSDVQWLRQWRGYCNPKTFNINQQAMQQLAVLSQHRLSDWIARTGMEIEVRSGLLVVARTEKELQALNQRAAILQQWERPCHLLNPDECRLIEPALNPDTPLVGALHLPAEGSANCRQFANLLKSACQSLPVDWRFDQQVARLMPGTKPTVVVESKTGHPETFDFDHIAVCTGAGSAPLLSTLGINLAIAPIQGYSISAPIREPINAPFSSVIDGHFDITITRLENRVRVSGIHQIGGQGLPISHRQVATLYKVLNDWFPGGALTSGTLQQWQGVRPMLPDGLPLIGPSGQENIWLNVGHGASGWALGCASAVVLREQMTQITPSVDIAPFQMARYNRP